MLPREYPNLYIDGRWQEPDSNERLEVISPSTGEKIGYVPAGNATDIDRAVEAARKAFFGPTGRLRPVEDHTRDDGAARRPARRPSAGVPRSHRRRARTVPKLTAEVYHSVAPTLHWNRRKKEHKFAGVREADLSAAGRQRGRADHEVREQEPARARAGRRRRRDDRVQLPDLRHRPDLVDRERRNPRARQREMVRPIVAVPLMDQDRAAASDRSPSQPPGS